MITKINYRDFKCFSDTSIECNNATLFLGVNSGGKSSAIQGILLNSMQMGSLKGYINLLNNSYSLLLHSHSEILNNESTSEDESFSITIEYDNEKSISRKYISETDDNILYFTQNIEVEEKEIIYLNANRSISEIQIPGNVQEMEIGKDNQYLAYIIERSMKNNVSAYRNRMIGEVDDAQPLDRQINFWLNYILPGNSVSASSAINSRYVSMLFGNSSKLHQENIGFGVSYVLPIIIGSLIAKEGSTLIVENPELHLHPSAQSNIAYFLALIASSGVQVFIETHSEHIVNGFRKAILKHDNPFNSNQLSLYFFDNAKEEIAKRIEVNDKAEIEIWPQGFMDQEEKDLYEMRKLRF